MSNETEVVESPTESALESPSGATEATANQRAEPTAEIAVAPDAATADTAAEDNGERPSERLKIGTQRVMEDAEAAMAAAADLKPRPVNPVTEGEAKPRDSKHYPPPNVRSAPTADEEAELAAMMAGASVSQVLDDAAAAAPAAIESGTRVTGKVLRVSGDLVFVELGQHLQGAVPLKQFEPRKPAEDAPAAVAEVPSAQTPAANSPAAQPATGAAAADGDLASYAPEVGTEVEVIVGEHNPDEGTYELSLPTAPVEVGNWDEVDVGKIVEVSITGHNKGGLECKVAGIRGFMPMGQVSLFRVENAEEYVGQRLTAVITEANRGRKNVILSHRAVMERERAEHKDKLLAELAPGQLREGIVRSLRDFGAFVDLGGVDGLIHVSKLSWDRIGHPKEVLTEGQKVKVKVEKIDPETGKIALSYREVAVNPWDSAEADFPIGSTVKGKVSKTMDFGAFVRLAAGVEGLIHISELDHKRVHRVTDVVQEGQEVEAKVLSVDRSKQRIALSLKALLAAPAKPDARPAEEDLPEDPTPQRPRKEFKNLKGGIGAPTGGEQFGLKW